MKRFKSASISIKKQTAIGKFKKDNPKMSNTSIADAFKCTEHQVRNAIKKYNNGEIKRPVSNRPRKGNKAIETILQEIKSNPEHLYKLLEKQLHTALAQLEIGGANIDVSERVKLTLELTKSILAVNLRGLDMRVISEIFRSYEPNITDPEIVERLHVLKDKIK